MDRPNDTIRLPSFVFPLFKLLRGCCLDPVEKIQVVSQKIGVSVRHAQELVIVDIKLQGLHGLVLVEPPRGLLLARIVTPNVERAKPDTQGAAYRFSPPSRNEISLCSLWRPQKGLEIHGAGQVLHDLGIR